MNITNSSTNIKKLWITNDLRTHQLDIYKVMFYLKPVFYEFFF